MVQLFNWEITVGTVASVRSVTEPELPKMIMPPALDGRIVLHIETRK